MPTTASDFAPTVTAAGVTDVTVTRVWPSVTTATATFTGVYPGQIGEWSPNVARDEGQDNLKYGSCALFAAADSLDSCDNPSEENKDSCESVFLLGGICEPSSEEEVKGALEAAGSEFATEAEDIEGLEALNNLKLKSLPHDKRSFLESYAVWCDNLDDATLANAAAGFFGVHIETEEQRADWLKVGQAFHTFYCGDEGGARALWELISTVEPWDELATATSVPLTLVWESGDAATTTPEPTPDPLGAMEEVGMEISDDDDGANSPEPQERYFDFDESVWVSSLLTATTTPTAPVRLETPDAAMQPGESEDDERGNYEREDCPHCSQGAGLTLSTGLLGGAMICAGLFMTFSI